MQGLLIFAVMKGDKIDGYTQLREAVMVHNPLKTARIIPSLCDWKEETKEERRAWKIKNRKRILWNVLKFIGIVVVGTGLSAGGSILFQGLDCGSGLSYMWGICCGLMMLIAYFYII